MLCCCWGCVTCDHVLQSPSGSCAVLWSETKVLPAVPHAQEKKMHSEQLLWQFLVLTHPTQHKDIQHEEKVADNPLVSTALDQAPSKKRFT